MAAFTRTFSFALLTVAVAATQAYQESGNWYQNQISSIRYNNFGTNGTYQRVVDMQNCQKVPQAYGGSLAPFNEEVAMVFRGPVQLKQFAAYTMSDSPERLKDKRDAEPRGHAQVHKHRHAIFHARRQALREDTQVVQENLEKRHETVIVATDPKYGVMSWTTDIPGPADPTTPPVQPAPAAGANGDNEAAPAPAPAPAAPDAKVKAAAPANPGPEDVSPPKPAPGGAPSYGSDQPPTNPGQWAQVASYDSSAQKSNGLTFLKTKFGPLKYMTADGSSTCDSPQVLRDTLIPSGEEIILFSDKKCSGQNGDCGYYNPVNTAYHGWAGSKIFLFEFAMPMDSSAVPNTFQADTPAIWLLNALVPRTEQYGCSCWDSGCGELDIFETLTQGQQKCKSTIHDAQALGSSDWFQRPTGSPVKAAVYMHDHTLVIKMLDGSFDIGGDFDAGSIKKIVENPATVTSLPEA